MNAMKARAEAAKARLARLVDLRSRRYYHISTAEFDDAFADPLVPARGGGDSSKRDGLPASESLHTLGSQSETRPSPSPPPPGSRAESAPYADKNCRRHD